MPEQASTFASRYDALYYFLLASCLLIAGGVFIALVYFAIKYRRRSADEVPVQTEGALKLELAWTIIPLLLSLIPFGWATILYVDMYRPPDDAMNIFVVGRQWMWKFQQPDGQWENNELHVPVGRPVQLTMTSQDVIHDVWVPAFRTKMDVLPGRYTNMWFTATKPGEYNLFCAEYCGTEHSNMVGTVYAMEERDYQTWLAGERAEQSPAEEGAELFQQLGCSGCHLAEGQGRGPNLVGLYGQTEELANGQTVEVDDEYIRESILNPEAKIVAGFAEPSIMPTYQGQVSEEQLLQLIAYIQSLGEQEQAPDDNTPPSEVEEGAEGDQADPGDGVSGDRPSTGESGTDNEGGDTDQGGQDTGETGSDSENDAP